MLEIEIETLVGIGRRRNFALLRQRPNIAQWQCEFSARTLNVLLSFAQFEREVTGERIRDKIAASKARGIWMGGNLPLGYDVQDRKLVIVEHEAGQVRHIYNRYLELGSVPELVRELDRDGIRSKSWTARNGSVHGGTRFTCGPVYYILANRIYLGEIVHKGKIHDGEHQPIISQELFDAVAVKLESHRVKRVRRKTRATTSPLTDKIFDNDGLPMRPTFGHGCGKRIYRYYTSESLLPTGRSTHGHNRGGERLSATRLERILAGALLPLFPTGTDADGVFAAVTRIRRQDGKLKIRLTMAALAGEDDSDADVLDRAIEVDSNAAIVDDELKVSIAATAVKRGKTVVASGHIVDDVERRKLFADLVRKSHALLTKLNASPLEPQLHGQMTVPVNEWSRERMGIGLLAPDIQKMLLQGKVPNHIGPEILVSRSLPMDWDEQRRMLLRSGRQLKSEGSARAPQMLD